MQSCFPYSFNGTAKSVRKLHQLSCNQVYLAEAVQNNPLKPKPDCTDAVFIGIFSFS
jgi:hypothetical protein